MSRLTPNAAAELCGKSRATILRAITPEDLPVFAGHPVGIVIAGRSIVAADDPKAAAKRLRSTLDEVWPQ